MHEDICEIMITEEEIVAKVVELGEQITRDYQDKNLLLLGTLKGAVPFIADPRISSIAVSHCITRWMCCGSVVL